MCGFHKISKFLSLTQYTLIETVFIRDQKGHYNNLPSLSFYNGNAIL